MKTVFSIALLSYLITISTAFIINFHSHTITGLSGAITGLFLCSAPYFVLSINLKTLVGE